MRAIVNTAPDRLEMCDLPMPQPGPGQVRIHTGAVGICATDLQMIAGWERTGFPAIPGHEWSGTVDAVGPGVDASLVGKRCVGENALSIGGEIGFEHPGGYAEYFITEAANVHTVSPSVPFTTLPLVEPLAVSVRALNRLGNIPNGPVLVIGDGPIGLLITLLLSKRGLDITTIGGREYRLDLAKDFGAKQVLNYHAFESNMESEVRLQTSLEFPIVIEASGSSAAMEASLNIVAPAGKVLMVGDYGDAHASMPWNQILWREVTMIGSNASADAWPEAVRLAVEDRLPIEKLITHKRKAAEFAKAFDIMHNRESKATKVVLEWQ